MAAGGSSEGARFRIELASLVERIAPAGSWNALARTAIQLCAPGVPDLYQGDELWQLTLVDPDNRGAIDFEARRRMLRALPDLPLRGDLEAPLRNGRLKLGLIRALLRLRAERPRLFSASACRRLAARGPRSGNIFEFARMHGEQALLVACAVRIAPGSRARVSRPTPSRARGSRSPQRSAGPCARCSPGSGRSPKRPSSSERSSARPRSPYWSTRSPERLRRAALACARSVTHHPACSQA